MKVPLNLCFDDFEKAFVSTRMSRKTMGKILWHYGIPVEFVRVIMNTQENASCKVMVDGYLCESFEVNPCVIQGGVLPPLPFVLVIDYVIKRVKTETDAGILWGENRKLLDFDYADDIVLICHGPGEIQSV